MGTSLIPGAQIGLAVGSASKFTIPATTQRRDPWLWLLDGSGDQLAVFYDFNKQAILCRRIAWNGATWDLSAIVTIVPSVLLGGFASFGNSQKLVLSYLDASGRVRFARSFDDGDTWQNDVAEG